MMERRRALTIPFTVDKEKMMENPLRIPITCRSSDCGKLEGQVSWTAIAGCNFRHKNGSMMFDHNRAAMINLEMARRKPLLILTDVLKTELGKAYMEKLENIGTMSNREQLTSPRRESGRCREEPPLTRRDARSSQNQETRNNRSKSVTHKRNQKTTPSSSSQRSRLRRKLQNADEEEDNDESEDIEEVILGRDSGEEDKFAEVVDCGLSLSWEHEKDAAGCNKFSRDGIKRRLSERENDVQHSLKRKRKGSVSQCNGESSPKRHRESVLRFTIEDEGARGPTPTSVSQEDGEEEIDMENLGRCIVQFTVGEDDQMEALVPVLTPSLEAGDIISNLRQSLLSREDSATQTSPTEPIVLSSDEEENGERSEHRSRALREDREVQGKPSLEAVSEQQEAPDMMFQLDVEGSPCSAPASPVHHMDYSCMSVAFCTLHYGGYQGRANGGLMIAENQIIIPLKGSSKQLNAMLTFERKELRRYSIWEHEELEERLIRFEGDEKPFPAAVLMFYVSETAAAAIQQDLLQLCIKEDVAINTEKASPFVLLTLRDPLVGMEGALLRSVLELDCINNLAHSQNFEAHGEDRVSGLEHISTPFLSLDESVELIERTGLDSHLLVMLSVKSADPELNTDWGGSHSDVDEIPTAHIWVDPDLEKESDLELETAPKEDTETQPELKEDQKEEALDKPPESRKEEAKPIYTLRRCRAKGSYSVSLSKPDSKWIKYKHQGLTRRLIQFPPPPLKGGITVTMEDLQCLDSGQYLNDVIIDFYLKYLLQNASAAVAERSHIFSSFFYKQLTRRDNASEGGSNDSCQRQRRHQRVKTWTRHVDIFKKDFLFVPVNQEAHWYLVVICFPGLDEPKCEDWRGESPSEDEAQGCKISNGDDETPPTLNPSDSGDTEAEKTPEETTTDPPPCPASCTERTCKRRTVCKRPCILIMDSLKLSLHERVFKLLREYLQSEWEVRQGSSRDFSPDQMKSSHCQVPLQDNSSDCGLYLLQYVECFLKDPVVHFDLPLNLQQWFPRQQVRRKRDEIRDLILNLYRHQNLDIEHTKQLSC
ncbi:sentrin-specific protease 7 isoform X2 [Leuresthes tenuis]|uniref:sentrin-specific protease 7 isoform X2 n=1 Tax=Leuresthes tenuis TaxID=355514 RepID=UPI003B50E182